MSEEGGKVGEEGNHEGRGGGNTLPLTSSKIHTRVHDDIIVIAAITMMSSCALAGIHIRDIAKLAL